MDNKKVNKRKHSATKIIPPKANSAPLSRDEIRSINKKKVKRRRKAKRLALLLFMAIAIICVCIVLVFSFFFKVGSVKVTGDNVYADKEIIQKSGIEIGESLFLIDAENLNETLTTALPYIKNVTVEKKLPDSVTLKISATREVAAFQKESGFVLVDETGKVLDKNSSMLRDGVAVVNGAKLKSAPEGGKVELSNGLTDDFISVLNAISNGKLKLLTEINVKEQGEFELRYDGRITIKLGTVDNVETKLKRAVATLEKENEINPYSEGVLDLRTDGFAYFRPGEEEATSKAEPVTDENGKVVPETTESTDENNDNNSDEGENTDE